MSKGAFVWGRLIFFRDACRLALICFASRVLIFYDQVVNSFQLFVYAVRLASIIENDELSQIYRSPSRSLIATAFVFVHKSR